MYRPPPPRMLYYAPRNYIHPNFRCPQNPRAFNKNYNSFNPVPPSSRDDTLNYWCETCDRGFPKVTLLEQHKQQHQKCNIDGCQFVAHPKVITKHIQMQHSSGLYKRIAKLDNPEEIKKWREERKKNYPTKLNIAKKSAELNEKIKRGEKMDLKYDKNKRRDKKERDIKPGTKRKYEYKSHQKFKRSKAEGNFSPVTKIAQSSRPPPKNSTQVMSAIEQKRILKPFGGIQQILINDESEEMESNNLLIDDDDDDKTNTININEQSINEEPSVCSALTSLMCNYGSSDEDNDSSCTEINTAKNLKTQITVHEITPRIVPRSHNEQKNKSEESKEIFKLKMNTLETPDNRVDDDDKVNDITPVTTDAMNDVDNTSVTTDAKVNDDDSGPEEAAIVKENKNDINTHGKENEPSIKIVPKKSHTVNKLVQKKTFVRPKSKLPSTLLQKLLFKEIRHERNIILQCIRYITKNNYFNAKTE